MPRTPLVNDVNETSCSSGVGSMASNIQVVSPKAIYLESRVWSLDPTGWRVAGQKHTVTKGGEFNINETFLVPASGAGITASGCISIQVVNSEKCGGVKYNGVQVTRRRKLTDK